MSRVQISEFYPSKSLDGKRAAVAFFHSSLKNLKIDQLPRVDRGQGCSGSIGDEQVLVWTWFLCLPCKLCCLAKDRTAVVIAVNWNEATQHWVKTKDRPSTLQTRQEYFFFPWQLLKQSNSQQHTCAKITDSYCSTFVDTCIFCYLPSSPFSPICIRFLKGLFFNKSTNFNMKLLLSIIWLSVLLAPFLIRTVCFA